MRSFIAVNLEKKLKERISEEQNLLKNQNCFFGSFPVPENLHYTLLFLGDVSEEQIKKIESSLSKIDFDEFELEISGYGVFPNENHTRVVWLGAKKGAEQLEKLAEKISLSLDPLGFKPDYKFSPHLTLARVRQIKNKNVFLEFLKENKDKRTCTLKVKSFELMSSKLSTKGANYAVIRTFPLN